MTTHIDPDFENVFDTVVSKPMKHDIRIEFALAEREVWTRAACAVASATDCKSTKTAITWANAITNAYVERFGTTVSTCKNV